MIRNLSAFILFSASMCAAPVFGQQTPAPADGLPQRSIRRIIVAAPFAGGYLGVRAMEITKENFAAYGLSGVRGVAIEGVAKDSPAAQAGLRKGDVILKFNGEEVTSVFKLTRLLAEIAPDHEAKITISRGATESEYTVTPAKREMPEFSEDVFGSFDGFPPIGAPGLRRVPMSPGEVLQFPADPNLLLNGRRPPRQIGVSVTNLTEQLSEYFGVKSGKGLLINKVGKDSPAAQAGILAGDVIVEADGSAVENNLDLLRALNQKKEGDVTLTIIRDKNRQTVTVTPKIARLAPDSFDGFGSMPPN